ncbi:hypothetical protein CAQU_10955 [Corynebacterium aquilae DSM 44791]|uniref:Uncharacterized protein n=2 Tax=Corynebacterium aquilae TaxID=203263 RepID=A0A1L7CI91_9CORY|nr:hypothetical protein CAQU_10955 [Corynebacterium aquilae DSM 44791]
MGRVAEVGKTSGGLTKITTEPVSVDDAYEKFEVSREYNDGDIIFYDPGNPNNRMDRAAFGTSFELSLFCGVKGEAKQEAKLKSLINFTDMRADADLTGKDGGFYFAVTPGIQLISNGELSELEGSLTCSLPDFLTSRFALPLGGPFMAKLSPLAGFSVTNKLSKTDTVSLRVPIEVAAGWGKYAPMLKPHAPVVDRSVESKESLHFQIDLGASIGIAGGPRIGEVSVDLDTIYSIEATYPTKTTKTESNGAVITTVETCPVFERSMRLWGGVRASIIFVLKVESGMEKELSRSRIDKPCELVSRGESPKDPSPTPDEPTPPVDKPSKPNLYSRLGELRGLTVNEFLRCRVDSPADGRSVFYGDDHCSTSLAVAVDRMTYSGDDWITGNEFEPVSGPEVSGAGTADDPLVIRTKVRPSGRKLLIEQIDTFVEGSGSYMTTINVTNEGDKAEEIIVYRGVDCYLNRDDWGHGVLTPRGAACIADDGRQIAFESFTEGERRFVGQYDTTWLLIGGADDLPNMAEDGRYDNGMAVSWKKQLRGGETASFRSNFELREPA